MTELTLSNQQNKAKNAIKDWFWSYKKSPKTTPQVFRLFGLAGTGKCQPLDSIVQTPFGERKIGDLVVGDIITSASGEEQFVTGVFPQGVKPLVKVSFRDGTETLCGDEHLWTVIDTHKRKRVMTSNEIMKIGLKNAAGYKFQVPLCGPIQYSTKPFRFHPYVVGAFIGDGTMTASTPILSVPETKVFVANKVASLIPDDYRVGYSAPIDGKVGRMSVCYEKEYHKNPFMEFFTATGNAVRSEHKSIPEEYLYGDVEQRLELLRGLMDADGCSSNNRITLSTSSLQLATDVRRLVQSLGGLPSLGAKSVAISL